MRASRGVLVAGGCAGILGAGWSAAPDALPTLDLAAPAGEAPPAVEAPAPAPSPSCVPAAQRLAAAQVEEERAEQAADAAKESGDEAAEERAEAAEDAAKDAREEAEDAVRRGDDVCVLVTPAPIAPATDGGADPAATTVDGPVVSNARGDYQARITVVDGVVTDVQAVVAGTSASESVQINATAIPELRSRILAAQSWEVEAVSGASFTSPAMLESVRGAFAEAGL